MRNQITVDRYRSGRISIGGDTQTDIIYRIRRYCKATSEYSPVRSIGLTLIASIFPGYIQGKLVMV